jgi:hypothetical protein
MQAVTLEPSFSTLGGPKAHDIFEVDAGYLAEVFRGLREVPVAHLLDKYFRPGASLNRRDGKAVRTPSLAWSSSSTPTRKSRKTSLRST